MSKQARHIYVLRDPDSREVRYVGQTSDPDVRLSLHIYGARSATSKKTLWVRRLRTAGKVPIMEVIETVTAEGADAAERRWIDHYRAVGANLLNSKPGGDVRRPRRKMTEKVACCFGLAPRARLTLENLAKASGRPMSQIVEDVIFTALSSRQPPAPDGEER